MNYNKTLTDLMLLECNICKKLFKKLPKKKLNYRPAKNMRSTLELLRYVSFCGTECTRLILLDSFKTKDWARYEAAAKNAEKMAPARFPREMDAQIKAVKKLIADIPEKDFTHRMITMPAGGKMPLGAALMTMPVRFMSGYRMQLFLYAKASGNSKLGTKDCWF